MLYFLSLISPLVAVFLLLISRCSVAVIRLPLFFGESIAVAES